MTATRYPISLKKLFVGLVLPLLVVGWLQQFVRERIIVLKLQERGGQVWYQCGHAARVSFPEGSDFGDSDMPLLGALRDLGSVDLSFTHVTSDGLESLKGLQHLRLLSVLVKQISEQQEEELHQACPELAIEKLWLVDGIRAVDGYQ
jgi:hypothetical protein